MKSSSPVSISLRKVLRQPGFLIAAGVLLVAAISLNAATAFLQLYFKKIPVEMAADFSTIPARLGPWVQVSKDERLSDDMEHELGAVHYLYRDYVDSRLVSDQEIAALFDGKSNTDRKKASAWLQHQKPKAVISVGLTYYTGMVDTVAHVPDRCYIADDYEPSRYDVARWSAFEGRPQRNENSDVRFINFEDQNPSRQAESKNVAYFFHANGTYTSDPIGVRTQLQDLRQRYAYYSKIELMTQIHDADEASAVMNDFLKPALPEIEKCFPDWQALTKKK